MTSTERAFRKWFREVNGKADGLDREDCCMAFHAGWHAARQRDLAVNARLTMTTVKGNKR